MGGRRPNLLTGVLAVGAARNERAAPASKVYYALLRAADTGDLASAMGQMERWKAEEAGAGGQRGE